MHAIVTEWKRRCAECRSDPRCSRSILRFNRAARDEWRTAIYQPAPTSLSTRSKCFRKMPNAYAITATMPSASLYTPSVTNVARADAAELAEQAEPTAAMLEKPEPKYTSREAAEPEKPEPAQPETEATIALPRLKAIWQRVSSVREQEGKRKGRKGRDTQKETKSENDSESRNKQEDRKDWKNKAVKR